MTSKCASIWARACGASDTSKQPAVSASEVEGDPPGRWGCSFFGKPESKVGVGSMQSSRKDFMFPRRRNEGLQNSRKSISLKARSAPASIGTHLQLSTWIKKQCQ